TPPMTERWQVNFPSGSGRSTASVHRIVRGFFRSVYRPGVFVEAFRVAIKYTVLRLEPRVYLAPRRRNQVCILLANPYFANEFILPKKPLDPK
ncbi:MAG: hypothetical protein ACK5O8_11900, partial [Pirellula sp.]